VYLPLPPVVDPPVPVEVAPPVPVPVPEDPLDVDVSEVDPEDAVVTWSHPSMENDPVQLKGGAMVRLTPAQFLPGMVPLYITGTEHQPQ